MKIAKPSFFQLPQARVLILLTGLLPIASYALSGDADQPIQVEANQLEVSDQDNISTYSGNVRLDQGSLAIRSEHLVIKTEGGDQLMIMEMTGKPATFRQTDDQQQEVYGEADTIEYNESKSTVIFLGNAKLIQGGDSIEGQKIHFNTATNRLKAGSDKGPESRVRMLIQPRKK